MTLKPLILVVDDEPAILKMLQGSLEDEGFRVETLSEGSVVLETIGKLIPDVVLLDIFMPHFDGMQMLKAIKQEYPQQHVMLISGFGTIQIAIQAIQHGALGFIEKPFTLDDVLEKLAFTKKQVASPPEEIPVERSYLVGESVLFYELLSQARLLAPLSLPIIIYGPTGSGKTLLARYIHDMSTYADKRFIVVDQKSIWSLTEHQLASPATLLLKYLDKADEAYQARILDFICNYPHLRIIASSAPCLFSRMQQGLFDSTLFCKLNVTPLEIAAITKRRYDIPLLVNNFLEEANKKYNTTVTLSTDAMRLLRNHHWTGDIAQIKQFVERLVAETIQATIVPVTLDALRLKNILPESPASFFEEQSYTRFDSIDTATHEFQREYVSHLLKKYRYDIQQLAEFLNISVDALHDTMHKLHINLH